MHPRRGTTRAALAATYSSRKERATLGHGSHPPDVSAASRSIVARGYPICVVKSSQVENAEEGDTGIHRFETDEDASEAAISCTILLQGVCPS